METSLFSATREGNFEVIKYLDESFYAKVDFT